MEKELMKSRIPETLENPSKNGTIPGKSPVNGQFLPGNTLGTGKPKGTKHFATMFMEVLKQEIQLKDGKKMTMSRAMTEAMVRKAIRGDVHAFDSIADRVDGKPKQDMEIEVSQAPMPIYSGKSIKKKTGK